MRLRLTPILVCLLLNSGCGSLSNQGSDYDNLPNLYDRRTGKVAITDEKIAIKARDDLSNDPLIPYQSRINVTVFNGTLLLTGEAPSDTLHKHIVEKVRIIQGVQRVQDEISIDHALDPAAQNEDSRITNRIKTELDSIHQPADFNSANVTVVTEGGNVYLMGLVYKEEADAASLVAQKIPGVKKIVKLFEYLQ